MNSSIKDIADSLASHLSAKFPGATFYEDPNQQKTSLPCFFLQQRNAKIKKLLDGRYLRTISLDLTYLEDYNLPDLQKRYEAVAEDLDICMETFPYLSGQESTLLRAYDRSWSIDLDAMHYKFEIRVFVTLEEAFIPMESLEQNEVIN